MSFSFLATIFVIVVAILTLGSVLFLRYFQEAFYCYHCVATSICFSFQGYSLQRLTSWLPLIWLSGCWLAGSTPDGAERRRSATPSSHANAYPVRSLHGCRSAFGQFAPSVSSQLSYLNKAHCTGRQTTWPLLAAHLLPALSGILANWNLIID